MSTPRQMCDGWDVATEAGVLHFAAEPVQAEVDALVASLLQPAPLPVVEPVAAEDGTLI